MGWAWPRGHLHTGMVGAGSPWHQGALGEQTPHTVPLHRSPLHCPWTDRLTYTRTQGSQFPQETATRPKWDKDFWQVPWEHETPSPAPAWPCEGFPGAKAGEQEVEEVKDEDRHGRCCPLVAQPLHDTRAQKGAGDTQGGTGCSSYTKAGDGAPGWHGQATTCSPPRVPHQWVYARMLRGATSAWPSHAQG